MTITAKQCISYRHERTCQDLIILLLPAHFYAFQTSSSCVIPIAVLHLTVDGYTLHVDYTYSYNDRRLVRAVRK